MNNKKLHTEQIKHIIDSIYYEYFEQPDDIDISVNENYDYTNVIILRKELPNIEFELDTDIMTNLNVFTKNVHKQMIKCRRNNNQ